MTSIEAQPVVYPRGALQRLLGDPDAPPLVTFRSRLEADWANTLDRLGIDWDYEPELFTLPSGAQYLPDFHLPQLDTWLEVKGTGIPRLDKTTEFARTVGSLVVVGHPPEFTPGQGFHARSRGAVERVSFARCTNCSSYQWVTSWACRRCRAHLLEHQFYRHDAPFHPSPWGGG